MAILLLKGSCPRDFKKVVNLPDGNACTITKALVPYFESVEFSIDSLSSFSSDGVPVMNGRHSGVAARLCAMNAQSIPVHCIRH